MTAMGKSELDTLFSEACSLRDRGLFREAEGILLRIVEAGSATLEVRLVLGDVCWEQARTGEAALHFRAAIALDPADERASLALFHCLWEQGDNDAAFTEARRFLGVRESSEYRRLIAEWHAELFPEH